jgi:hypothetical protein
MEHKGVEYTVVQMVDGTGWRWEVRFGGGKNKIRCNPAQSSGGNQTR